MMNYLIYGHREGAFDIEADDFRQAVIKFRKQTGQRAVALSVREGGMTRGADQLLKELFQWDGPRGPVTVFENYPGGGYAALADWVVVNHQGDVAGYVVDDRSGDASPVSDESEDSKPFEAWTPYRGSAERELIGNWHSLRGAATVVANRYNRT